MYRSLSTCLLLLFLVNFTISAQQNPPTKQGFTDTTAIELKHVVISANVFFGSKQKAINRAGSGYFLSSAELGKQFQTDISRILAKVPGVTSYDEDGFGLRPNISIRGVSAERSAKITVMEDGVLIAPAPYAAPAAYYFPTAGRMSAVEVLKGSSQIEYGPFTTGGAINFVSTPIPSEKLQLKARALYGSYGNRQVTLAVGGPISEQVAWLVEGFHQGSNGFKELPNGHNTGFKKQEVLGKLRFKTKATARWQQALELKGQYGTEDANETYLGITATDFAANPFQRYSSSDKDSILTTHKQLMATHTLDLGQSFRVTTVGYWNSFARNWYKLDAITLNGTRYSLASLLNTPTRNQGALDILRGTANSAANALAVKNNNRVYGARGIQTKIDKHWMTGNTLHDMEVGVRWHTDYEDRLQWVDGYQMLNGAMQLNKIGEKGSDANAITKANALSAHALYKITLRDKLTLSPGVRYEQVNLTASNYGKADANRVGTSLTVKENNVSALIPGMGFTYEPTKKLVFFGGVHKGFSPPSTDAGSLPESSINYETGVRILQKGLYAELVGYRTNYANLLGSDLAASGGTGTLTQFNAGKVLVQGIELLLNYNALQGFSENWKLPIEGSYTLTASEFLSSFQSKDEIWGKVNVGDELPYIPKHQFFISAGVENSQFSAQLTGRYNGQFRTMAGSGSIAEEVKVPSYFVMDLGTAYQVTKQVKLHLNANNLLNNKYLVARVPAGLRPGHPLAIMGGLSVCL